MRRNTFGTFFMLLLVTCVTMFSVTAQDACPALVQKALAGLETNCTDVNRNTACYGYNQVSAKFFTPVADDYFATPADRASISEMSAIQTAALNVETDEWGVALLNVQASMPDSLPGQGALFVLIGDAELENAVDPQEAFVPGEPIDVVTSVDANIRTGGGREFNTLGAVKKGTTLPADARNSVGDWVRVVYGERPAWVSVTVLDANDAIANLPVLDADARTPMQAFYLRTGVGQATCEEAPKDALVVQGPQKVKLELTVNGAEIRIGSSVAFNTPDDNTLEISVLDGEAVIIGGGEDGEDVVVPEGFTTKACLGDPQDLGEDGDENDREVSCAFEEPTRDATQDDNYCFLQNLPASQLFYGIDLVCSGEAPVQQASRIGSCNEFRVVSPTGGFSAFGDDVYRWTGVESADEYVINFQRSNGEFIIAVYVGNVTSATYRNASLPIGEYRWIVLALKDQQILCSTPTSDIVYRSDNPEVAPVTGPAPFSIQWVCAGYMTAKISFNNLYPEEEYITISATYPGPSTYNSTSGSYTFGSYQTVTYVSGPDGTYSGSWGPVYC